MKAERFSALVTELAQMGGYDRHLLIGQIGADLHFFCEPPLERRELRDLLLALAHSLENPTTMN